MLFLTSEVWSSHVIRESSSLNLSSFSPIYYYPRCLSFGRSTIVAW